VGGASTSSKDAAMLIADICRFLMARLSMDALGASKAQTKNGFLDSLRNLPDTPKDLYRELWARIKDQDEGTFVIAQQIFAWVTYSRRTLTPEELQQGLYFHEHHRPWHDDVSGDLIQPEDVATICLGIICQKSETGVMGFEHHTAEIFFPEFFANEHEGFAPQAQIWIATACLNHIKSTERESTSQRPLDDYAALFWGDHVRNTAHHDDYEALFQDEHVSDSVHLNMDSAVMRFLLDEHCICQAAELFARAARRNGHSPQPAEHIRALHLAAYFGLNSVVARLISDEHVTVDTRAPEPNSWTAIRWAVHNAQEDTVLLLLWKGADLELLYHDGNTLLMVLLGADTQRLQMWPWSTIFETITTTESSKTHFGNTYYWSPGSSARHDPSNDVDRHLYHVLHNSHCIETRNCSGLTALHIAARRGSRSEGAALQLIQTGARIDTKSTDGFTPLLSALQPRRDKKYSKFIIRDQSGCQIGLQHYWDVPLAVLADNKYYEIDRDGPAVSEELIVALTDAKVDLEAKDTWGRTALSYAAACGFRKAVSSLLEARANTETIDHCGRTPLIWSLRRHALHRYLLEDFIITDDARVFISDSVEIDGLRHASVDPRVFSDVSTSRCLIAITLAERTTAVAHRDNGGKSAFDLANDEGLNPLARILKDREQETGGVVVADSPVSLFNCYALDDARVAIGHHIGGVMSLDNVIVSERGRMMIGSVGTRPADAGIATDIPRPMVDFMVRNVIVSGEARLHIEGMQARGGHNQSRIPSRLATATEEWLIHSDGSRERLDFAHFRDTTVEGSYNYE
jgi:ankyrin repeat protein